MARDDLPDHGANLFISTINEIRKIDPKIKIEVLDLIRNEKKFNSLKDLEKQLISDKKLCEDLIKKL